MRLRSWGRLLLLAALCTAPVLAAAGFTIPPTPDRYVTDPGNVLGAATQSALEGELRSYEKATGHQIIVWIGQTTGDVPLETFTGETADHWKIGRRGLDDGAVLFAFMHDRKVRIEVGYGLEGKLPDADAKRIIDTDILPQMRAGNVDRAISSGVAAMLATVTPTFKSGALPPAAAPSSDDSKDWIPWLIFIAIVAFLIVVQVVQTIRYGYLVVRKGPTAARKAMRHTGFFFGLGTGAMWGSGGGGFSGGGFSAGGGGFGGGGASGGW